MGYVFVLMKSRFLTTHLRWTLNFHVPHFNGKLSDESERLENGPIKDQAEKPVRRQFHSKDTNDISRETDVSSRLFGSVNNSYIRDIVTDFFYTSNGQSPIMREVASPSMNGASVRSETNDALGITTTAFPDEFEIPHVAELSEGSESIENDRYRVVRSQSTVDDVSSLAVKDDNTTVSQTQQSP
eukprot:303229_1